MNQLDITSFDHEDLKQNLITFLQSTGKFGDFDFEGSTLNTIIDLLVRNTHYDSFLANMLANESFLDSAQLRSNVVSHAQKLSYTPRSATASRLICEIEVIPISTVDIPTSVVLESGTAFVGNAGGQVFTFTNIDPYTLTYSSLTKSYKKDNVELFQGYLITNNFSHVTNTPIEVPNDRCDTTTLSVTGTVNGGLRTYNKADTINVLNDTASVFFLSENYLSRPLITFGRNILGHEPDNNNNVRVTYVVVEEKHANGVTSLISTSLIGGYSNINVNVTTKSYGGADKESIEDIRFIAPKYYQAQARGLSDRDYIPLLKQRYSFIKNAISWGGEKNNPPVYGTVFVSILSEEGGLITNAVKQQMQEYLSDYNVGSITPTITDPELYGIDLQIAFSYDSRITSKSFNQLSIDVTDVVNNYNEELFNFDQYYNEAELNKRIMSLKGIVSIDIDKEQFFTIEVLRFDNPVYTIDFGNELEPETIRMENFILASDGSDHKLYDNGTGSLIVEYINSFDQTVTNNVGQVDYESGQIEFTLNMIQEESNVIMYAQTLSDNFYIKQNKVVYINSIETSLLDTVDRITQTLRQ